MLCSLYEIIEVTPSSLYIIKYYIYFLFQTFVVWWYFQNAALGGVPNFEHDENLFLDKREQLSYNIEDRHRVDAKVRKVTRKELLNPPFYHEASRFQSELMYRMDNPEEQLLPDN